MAPWWIRVCAPSPDGRHGPGCPAPSSVADSVPRRPTRNRSPSTVFDDCGSPVMPSRCAGRVRGTRPRPCARHRSRRPFPRPKSATTDRCQAWSGCGGDEAFQRDHERGDAALHPPPRPVQQAVRTSARNGSLDHAPPARRHHVSWPAQQDEHRTAVAVRLPQVVVRPRRTQVLAVKPARSGPLGDQRLQPASSGVTDARARVIGERRSCGELERPKDLSSGAKRWVASAQDRRSGFSEQRSLEALATTPVVGDDDGAPDQLRIFLAIRHRCPASRGSAPVRAMWSTTC